MVALEYNEWIKLAYEKGYILKWDDLKKLKENNTLVLAASLSQGYYVGNIEENKVCNPTDFFRFNKQKYIHYGFVDDNGECRSKGNLNGDDYPDGLFYEFEGDAVLGSGADFSMLWKNLKKMPKIYYDDIA